jgi:hypothetical protein
MRRHRGRPSTRQRRCTTSAGRPELEPRSGRASCQTSWNATKPRGPDSGSNQTWRRGSAYTVTALLLVIAIDQVLTFEERVRQLTGDAELRRDRENFDAVGLRASAIRDLVAHLDEYATGTGRRQTGKEQPPITDPYLQTYLFWTDGGGTMLRLGDDYLNLRAASQAAIALAEVVERVRAKYLDRAERDANAALRRRYGLSQ